MLDFDYLDRLETYMDSGDMEFEFSNGEEGRRGEILDFLERLMDLSEKADQWATKLIFPGGMPGDPGPTAGDGKSGGGNGSGR